MDLMLNAQWLRIWSLRRNLRKVDAEYEQQLHEYRDNARYSPFAAQHYEQLQNHQSYARSPFADPLQEIESSRLVRHAKKYHIHLDDFDPPNGAESHWVEGYQGESFLHHKTERELARRVSAAKREHRKEVVPFWFGLIAALTAILSVLLTYLMN